MYAFNSESIINPVIRTLTVKYAHTIAVHLCECIPLFLQVLLLLLVTSSLFNIPFITFL